MKMKEKGHWKGPNSATQITSGTATGRFDYFTYMKNSGSDSFTNVCEQNLFCFNYIFIC